MLIKFLIKLQRIIFKILKLLFLKKFKILEINIINYMKFLLIIIINECFLCLKLKKKFKLNS